MSKSVTAIEKKIAVNEQKINELIAENKALSKELSNANGRKKFTFPTGETYAFKDLIIVRHMWIDKGLGYSEDVEKFGEYKIRHKDIDYDVRFLSREAIEKIGIPVNESWQHQLNMEFESRFGSMVEEIFNETPWQVRRDFRNT